MEQIKKSFYVKISPDRLRANLYCTDKYMQHNDRFDRERIDKFLEEHHITYGINEEKIELLLTNPPASKFPITIANGFPAKSGKDGEVVYNFNFSLEVEKTPDWNFRDIMRIPSVQSGEKLATIVSPTAGKEGTNILGQSIPAKPGKPVTMKAGKNVQYNETDTAFYATLEGQASVQNQMLQVQPIFEVNDSLSMETGNLNFIGAIIIHGDVPTGFTVKAEGDIKIYGMVEAAKIISGGSIYISEGIAGLQKGYIKAAHNIYVGYINQGITSAGETIYVDNSILHSECEAKKDIYCQQGNIIGGSLSAGQVIEAKDIGNRLSTKTEISLGTSKTMSLQEQRLLANKEELKVRLENLEVIGKKLQSQNTKSKQIQVTLQRQKNSYQKTGKQLDEIKAALMKLNTNLGDETTAQLIVNNHMYPNTIISFGKYKRSIQTYHHYVQVFLKQQEIAIQTLHQ